MSYSGGDLPTRCLRFFDEIDRGFGKASKWDLIKLAGSEAQFDRWIKRFLLLHKFLREIEKGKHRFFEKTEKGQIFHDTLKARYLVVTYKRLSRKS